MLKAQVSVLTEKSCISVTTADYISGGFNVAADKSFYSNHLCFLQRGCGYLCYFKASQRGHSGVTDGWGQRVTLVS